MALSVKPLALFFSPAPRNSGFKAIPLVKGPLLLRTLHSHLSVSVVVMCANATTIREILLAAEELGMVDSGEYVFFSIELTSR